MFNTVSSGLPSYQLRSHATPLSFFTKKNAPHECSGNSRGLTITKYKKAKRQTLSTYQSIHPPLQDPLCNFSWCSAPESINIKRM